MWVYFSGKQHNCFNPLIIKMNMKRNSAHDTFCNFQNSSKPKWDCTFTWQMHFVLISIPCLFIRTSSVTDLPFTSCTPCCHYSSAFNWKWRWICPGNIIHYIDIYLQTLSQLVIPFDQLIQKALYAWQSKGFTFVGDTNISPFSL